MGIESLGACTTPFCFQGHNDRLSLDGQSINNNPKRKKSIFKENVENDFFERKKIFFLQEI